MFRHLLKALVSTFALALLAACASQQIPEGTITQAGCFESFAAGNFTGATSISRLSDGAEIGLGTFDAVDGELIILDGEAYRGAFDGTVTKVDGSLKTPFAVSSKAKADFVVKLENGMSSKAVSAAIDKAVGQPGAFLAIKAKVRFATLTLRAPPPAQSPKDTLVSVIARQKVFKLKDVSGVLIGFRTPAAYKGLNVPGYHFHFISDDRKAGGHVLGFSVAEGSAGVQICKELLLIAPPDAPDFKGSQDSGVKGESAGH